MQELFLTVSRNIGRWGPSPEAGSFGGWLRRAVVQHLGHQLAQARRDRRVVGSGDSGMQALLEMLPAAEGPRAPRRASLFAITAN